MENRLSPMRELLVELLLEANEPAQALREFEMSLRNNMNRYRSFAGAAKAAERAGDRAQAKRRFLQSQPPARMESGDAAGRSL